MADFIKSDLEFILQQIFIAEANAAGTPLTELLPNSTVPWGLRTVDGSENHLQPGQDGFGSADNLFPSLVPPNPVYGPGTAVDSQPRTISNLIVDQTSNNPAARQAYADAGLGTLDEDGNLFDLDGNPIPLGTLLVIPNSAPDEGLSAGFNAWFTFFGQFFDHGLDLVQKGGNGIVLIPLQPDDPLFDPDSQTNFMVVTRASVVTLPGADGQLGTGDDETGNVNLTTPFVDQNQTYTSHPSHQAFLREYVLTANGPKATGGLITGVDGGMATWGDVKAQALNILGIELDDFDALNLPLLVTDAYGNFIPGADGFPQMVTGTNPDGTPLLAVRTAGVPLDGSLGLRTGHAFLDDIAHFANPIGDHDGNPLTPNQQLTRVVDGDPNGAPPATGFYDGDLLDAHFVAGDGRANENIALTAVHHVFHAEHNRLVEQTKAVVLEAAAGPNGDIAFLNQWLAVPVTSLPADTSTLVWNGERLFQAAKFGTEMQYQHLVFEEFARKIHPAVDAFLAPNGFDTTIDPSIVAEFAHAVYRLGHSMLLETVDRLSPEFASSEIGLIEAFLNPLAFNADGTLTPEQAAGAIVRGTTRQLGNEIDEFVTDALRNNLLGLPLDLAAINIARGRDTGLPTLNAARAQFYEMTGDSQLKPYESWNDLLSNLKHPASLVNFIAAYGTHSSITSATTLEDKREAAFDIVFGGGAVSNAERLAFLNGPAATTGVNAIDLWVGGLAEKIMPFGGMLGSTFTFVFETQMEALQNGDRFYYLSRLAGLNFLTEMENNSFAKLVMQHTDVTRLPADIFSTPGFILEVDQSKQFTGLGNDGRADPTEGGTELVPIVIRNNPATASPDTNYLRYTGDEHVVLGGTSGNDILIASIGDDTLWGDAGNDRLEGGDGNDVIEGGAGDDIITDLGGDDTLKGNDGNDVIHGGNGANLIIGGAGKDFIITGEDVSETFGGTGDDFILGAKTNLQTAGNEGNDWIEIGTQDGAPGDNFDPFATDSVKGHDVFVGGGGFDEMIGEGGDDIMVGSEGSDHFDGMSGYDWATYKNDRFGVSVDLMIDDQFEPPVPASNAGILDRFAEVEGLSGSAHSDILRGDNIDATTIRDHGGAQGSVLDAEGIALISGLQGFLNQMLGGNVTSFDGGNIILGGSGSDILEGRGGDDLLDGDRWLNVRVSVRANTDGTGAELFSVDSIRDLVPRMVSGEINPGQLVIVREILDNDNSFDTAVFSGLLESYTVTTVNGVTTVTDNVGDDGVDRLLNIERLQFADGALVRNAAGQFVAQGSVAVGNAAPVGRPTILDSVSNLADNTPQIGQVLRASVAGITDADNVTGTNTAGNLSGRPVSYVWQVERVNGSGIFEDIVTEGGDVPATANRGTLLVTGDLSGLALRVRVVYQDGHGVLENAYSLPTAVVSGTIPTPQPVILPVESEVVPINGGLHLIRADLQFILDQIKIAERHAAGESLLDLLPNSRVPFGLRTVDGSDNNLVRGQENFGAADQTFPLMLDPFFRNDEDGDSFDPDGPTGPTQTITNTNYAALNANGQTVSVVDVDPRIISNLIVDQTISNPMAVEAYVNAGLGSIVNGVLVDADGVVIPAGQPLFIPNTAPDEGLSAGFNSWFTLFGQFFDHGLDLVNKGGNGTIYIPLQADDPLFDKGADGIAGTADDGHTNFMVLSRATNVAIQAGADGDFGTADDIHLHNNQTTPFVDQNQTYTSHPSHQVFLREYVLVDGRPLDTGRLLNGSDGGLPTWADIKAQALNILGIRLDDADVLNLPLLATDPYGNFIPSATGFPMIVRATGGPLSGSLANPVDASLAIRTNHAFLDDIAHNAVPVFVNGVLAPDTDLPGEVTINPQTGQRLVYDDELLNAHFATGDGRGNENIGLTAVHHVFHSEHNRMVDHIKQVVLASNDLSFINEWLRVDVTQIPTSPAGLAWDGERLFQAARFSTEMQYQHLVFEEFARKVQPQVDIFFAPTQVYDTDINPAIVAEFAHVVYRFGHSMLTETVDRLDPNFVSSDMGLIEAFLNPLAFNQLRNPLRDPSNPNFDPNAPEFIHVDADAAAGAIVRGMTRQLGNEIDEFVTGALRNNLLGLPLDLATINLARGRDTGVPSLNDARAQFYEMTGDSQLKPYTSWVDFAMNMKHPESLVNFIAAYGTHSSITNATTTADKRAAAMLLVLGGAGAPEDRLDFLNSSGSWANGAPNRTTDLDGVTNTGLGNIDLWVGGLAERQMPFGGLLGSTFNFVFETQMEKLQDGDRFYYLDRTGGLNFLTELENNSFAKLIMANTNATHLPGDVFSTPGLILEVDQARQLNDGLGSADPVAAPGAIEPLVQRGANFLRYNGDEHVVLGGTSGNDTLVSSIGDDTLHGDAGNDKLEGGFGNDFLFGGAGDDILTDKGGDDNIQGGEGNDVIHGGNGIDLLLGGFGHDFIVKIEDESELFGGTGNDFLLAARANEMSFGNEGDDWIEHGMADGAAGDNFDSFGNDPIIGHDVFIGEFGIIDRMDGEGGDDIMLGNGGEGDRYVGMSGFDWAVFRDDPYGVNVDMTIRAFDETPIAPSTASLLARFEMVEGVSGSQHADILKGDSLDAAGILTSGVHGSVLNSAGIALIDGMQAFLTSAFGGPVSSFGSGNIMLGGGGSDLIEGRGGDDLIDGDKYLNVRISVRANSDGTGGQIATFNSMTEMVPFMLNGTYNPGQLKIVREILTGVDSYDTALFTGLASDYIVEFSGDTVIVTDTIAGRDGVDRLIGIERLQFNDVAVVLPGGETGNVAPVGLLAILDAATGQRDNTPVLGQLLRVSSSPVRDADNVSANNLAGEIRGPVTYYWQAETVAGSGIYEDIFLDTAAEVIRVTGATFRVTEDVAGLNLRVRAVYQDANGTLEIVHSGGNELPNGQPTIDIGDGVPVVGQLLTASIAGVSDPDGVNLANVTLQWQMLNDDLEFVDIPGATGAQFTVTQAQVGRQIQVVANFVDNFGTPESVASLPTQQVDADPTGAPVIEGLAVQGQVLTADTGDIDDADFIFSNFSFQWQQSTDGVNFTNIGGATGETLALGQAHVGKQVQVVVSYTDGLGIVETVTSTPTTAVANVNDAPTGAPTITGTARRGQVLTAQLAGIADIDGLTTSTFGLRWQVSTANGTFVDIAGANAAALTLAQAQVGQQVRLVTTFVDDGGTLETLVSGPTAIVGDVISGTASGDILIGSVGDDLLNGLGGDDILAGGLGDDTMAGGAGNDSYEVTEVGDVVTEATGEGIDAVFTRLSSYTLGANVESLVYVGTGNFTGIGNALNNYLQGSVGNDILAGGAGADTMVGGAGNDSYEVTDVGDVVVESAGEGIDTVFVRLSSHTLGANVESLVYVGTGNFTGIGNALNNYLQGGIGNDILAGGAGADTMVGGAGNDSYEVTDVGDVVVESAGEGIDTVFARLSNQTLGANVESVVYVGTGNFTGIGNALNNHLQGASGNDILAGGAGADTMVGGAGNDSYEVTDAGDVVVEGVNEGYDAVWTTLSSYTLGANVEALIYAGSGNFTGNGNVLDNYMLGGAGNDTLDGGAGNDVIVGGAGNDTMNASLGDDIFVFSASGFGADRILGFDAVAAGGQDRMDISGLGITAATFASSVQINAAGADTLINIGADSIRLVGVADAASVNATDFILAT